MYLLTKFLSRLSSFLLFDLITIFVFLSLNSCIINWLSSSLLIDLLEHFCSYRVTLLVPRLTFFVFITWYPQTTLRLSFTCYWNSAVNFSLLYRPISSRNSLRLCYVSLLRFFFLRTNELAQIKEVKAPLKQETSGLQSQRSILIIT